MPRQPITPVPPRTVPVKPRITPVYTTRLAPAIRPVAAADRFRGIDFHPPDTLVDGVFEGGAALGAAYMGSLFLMEQSRIWFRRVAGNSAGAITAAMVAAGYKAHEIEWLCSAYDDSPLPPRPVWNEGTRDGVHPALDPINFLDFLDFPTLASVGTEARRKTLLWRALKGEIVDNILNTPIPIPTRGNSIDSIVDGIKTGGPVGTAIMAVPGAENFIRDILGGLLGFLPTQQPKLRDFQLFDTTNLRIAFADAVWSSIASVNPMLVFTTQLLHEGSIFEGEFFRQKMIQLLGAKVHGDPTREVYFNELPIPLAVIGANIATKRMEVYSEGTTTPPQRRGELHYPISVAEAVRRSMSLPVIFQPHGNLVVDGGLCSNFPAWLFTAAGDSHWRAGSIDPQRPKIGLAVDEAKPAPARWGASPGKFRLVGDPPHVNLPDVAIPLLIAKFKAAGLYEDSPTFPEGQLMDILRGYKVLDVAIGSVGMNDQAIVRAIICQALFGNQTYFDVEIPALGFHAFDFAINTNASDLAAIAERGWFAARDALAANPTSGAPLINNPGALLNPY